jgi:hypothetical protein
MNKPTLRLAAAPLLVCLCALVPASAQKLRMDNLDTLFPKAVETVDVTIDGSLIKLAAKFLNSSKPDEAAVKELISALQGVYVKGVEFDRDNEYSESDVEGIRTQLRTPGWERIVGVRSKRENENVEVYLMMNGELITGVGALVWSARHLYVVNVVGPIDPEKIGQLRGRFGIPDLDFDFSGVGVRKYRKHDKS